MHSKIQINISIVKFFIMGGSSSKQQVSNENSGTVQNNISIEKTMEVHNRENTVLLSIICLIQIIELLLYIYKSFRRGLKRKFNTQTVPLQAATSFQVLPSQPPARHQ